MFFRANNSFASLYGVLAYDSEHKLFVLDNRKQPYIGMGFEIMPLSCNEANLQGRLEVLLGLSYPNNSFLQISLLGSPDINSMLVNDELVAMQYPKNEIIGNLLNSKIGFIREHMFTRVNGINTYIRNFKVLVTVGVPIASYTPTKKEQRDIENLRLSIQECLKTISFAVEPIDDENFIKIMSPYFNKGKESSWFRRKVKVNSEELLATQLLDYDHKLRWNDNHINLGGYIVNSYSVKSYPDYVFLGNAASYAGDMISGQRGVKVPFILTASILFVEQNNLLTELNLRRAMITHQAYGPLLKFVTKLCIRKEGFDTLYERLDKGERPLKFNLTLTTFAKDEEEAVAISSEVKSYYREKDINIFPDHHFLLPIFLNSLPFGVDIDAYKALARYKTFSSGQIPALLPLFAESKGAINGEINLISRTGQFMQLSLFASSTNYNCCIAAQSGSGKSFLVNEIIVSYLAQGAQIYVIDIGRSYEMLCEMIGGKFIAFNKENRFNLNPFRLIEDINEEADMLTSIVASMIIFKDKLSDYQYAYLKRIITELYEKYKKELTIDIVAETMEQHEDIRIKDMGQQLYAFCTNGTYGQYFNNDLGVGGIKVKDNFRDEDYQRMIDNQNQNNTMNIVDATDISNTNCNPKFNSNFNTSIFTAPNGQLTVLELEELKGRAHLQQVVLLQLIYQIQQEMYLGDKSVRKLIIIDESWDLLRDGDVAKFIETGYRRFRKYNGAAITVTQSVNDLYQNDIGRAIVENSANMYLLGQKSEVIDSLKSEHRLPLSDGEYDLLKSVHSVRGVYSEVFAISEWGNCIGRLVVDDFKKKLFSTKAEDVMVIKNYRNRGYSIEEAINAVIS